MNESELSVICMQNYSDHNKLRFFELYLRTTVPKQVIWGIQTKWDIVTFGSSHSLLKIKIYLQKFYTNKHKVISSQPQKHFINVSNFTGSNKQKWKIPKNYDNSKENLKLSLGKLIRNIWLHPGSFTVIR